MNINKIIFGEKRKIYFSSGTQIKFEAHHDTPSDNSKRELDKILGNADWRKESITTSQFDEYKTKIKEWGISKAIEIFNQYGDSENIVKSRALLLVNSVPGYSSLQPKTFEISVTMVDYYFANYFNLFKKYTPDNNFSGERGMFASKPNFNADVITEPEFKKFLDNKKITIERDTGSGVSKIIFNNPDLMANNNLPENSKVTLTYQTGIKELLPIKDNDGKTIIGFWVFDGDGDGSQFLSLKGNKVHARYVETNKLAHAKQGNEKNPVAGFGNYYSADYQASTIAKWGRGIANLYRRYVSGNAEKNYQLEKNWVASSTDAFERDINWGGLFTKGAPWTTSNDFDNLNFWQSQNMAFRNYGDIKKTNQKQAAQKHVSQKSTGDITLTGKEKSIPDGFATFNDDKIQLNVPNGEKRKVIIDDNFFNHKPNLKEIILLGNAELQISLENLNKLSSVKANKLIIPGFNQNSKIKTKKINIGSLNDGKNDIKFYLSYLFGNSDQKIYIGRNYFKVTNLQKITGSEKLVFLGDTIYAGYVDDSFKNNIKNYDCNGNQEEQNKAEVISLLCNYGNVDGGFFDSVKLDSTKLNQTQKDLIGQNFVDHFNIFPNKVTNNTNPKIDINDNKGDVQDINIDYSTKTMSIKFKNCVFEINFNNKKLVINDSIQSINIAPPQSNDILATPAQIPDDNFRNAANAALRKLQNLNPSAKLNLNNITEVIGTGDLLNTKGIENLPNLNSIVNKNGTVEFDDYQKINSLEKLDCKTLKADIPNSFKIKIKDFKVKNLCDKNDNEVDMRLSMFADTVNLFGAKPRSVDILRYYIDTGAIYKDFKIKNVSLDAIEKEIGTFINEKRKNENAKTSGEIFANWVCTPDNIHNIFQYIKKQGLNAVAFLNDLNQEQKNTIALNFFRNLDGSRFENRRTVKPFDSYSDVYDQNTGSLKSNKNVHYIRIYNEHGVKGIEFKFSKSPRDNYLGYKF